MTSLEADYKRYSKKKEMPTFQKYYRKCQCSKGILLLFYRVLYIIFARKNNVEIPRECQLGEGLYIGHPYGITINPGVVMGKNCNIHKGVTIGRENRGKRKGVPTIGNCVWIGVNATVVGNINIGDDVLIAPNSFVNCSIPSHSLVIGNPCFIKEHKEATQGYINNKIKGN